MRHWAASHTGVARAPWRRTRSADCVKTCTCPATTVNTFPIGLTLNLYTQWRPDSSAAQCQIVKGQASEQPADAIAAIATYASPICVLLSIRATRYETSPFLFTAARFRTSQNGILNVVR